ncbi:Transcriptional regulator [gamma proteobacterium HdN1]|nr:Transcriptional regulator [gamma proteobacterium HdN1]
MKIPPVTPPITRARDDDQKLARKQTLMDAGWHLFVKTGKMPSVSQVVHAAGLAKGTFYIYFKTKEDLFLELMSNALGEFFQELNDSLSNKDLELKNYVDLFVRKFHREHMVIKLGAFLAGVLEEKREEESVRNFRVTLVQQLQNAAHHLHERFPAIEEKKAVRLLLRSYAILLGVAQLIPSTPILPSRIEEEPGLEALALDFAEESKAILRALLASTVLFPAET